VDLDTPVSTQQIRNNTMVDGPVSKRKITRRMKRNAMLAGCTMVVLLVLGFFGRNYFISDENLTQVENADVEELSAAARPFAQEVAVFFENIKSRLSEYANSETTKNLFLTSGDMQLEQEASNAINQFPSALKLRLLRPGQYKVDDDSVSPLTFGSISLLNNAENSTGSIAAEVLLYGTDRQHIVMVERVKNQAEQLIGMVHLSLDVDLYRQVFSQINPGNKYLEIRQISSGSPLVLNSVGSPELKSGEPGTASIAGTRWVMAYWDEPTMVSADFLRNNSINTTILAIVLSIIVIVVAVVVLGKRKEMSDISSSNNHNISYEGAVKAIMEGAHPGMEKLISHMPGDKKEVSYTHCISEGLEGDDITSIMKPDDLNTTKQSGEVFDITQAAPEVKPTKVPEKKAKGDKVIHEKTESTHKNLEIPKVIFRKYDIRGIVDKNLTTEIVYKIGLAIGSQANDAGIKTIVVGRDGRHSSPDFAKSLINGLTSTGRDVIDIGIVPTPVLYYATHYLETGSGVMITGSHNGPEYNGLKIVLGGTTLSEEGVNGIYDRILAGNFSAGSGNVSTAEIIPEYIRRITEDIPVAFGSSFKLVVDCGNGAASVVAAQLFRAMGHDVIELFCELDGDFPNHHPDPSVPENLEPMIKKVKEEHADLGFAFDGDGDRLGVVDADGNILWPDRQMMVFAQDVLSRNQGAEIIFDVKCSSHLKKVIENCGGKALMWKTGHSLIKSKMKEINSPLAGEMSGHIFFGERWYGFDDALYSGARLLEILTNAKANPVKYFADFPEGISTPELKIDMPEEEHSGFMSELGSKISFDDANIITIDGFRIEFSDGWGLIRPSNTTPCLVARFEADSSDALTRIQGKFKELLLSINPGLVLPF
jgi:phosphomannomutase / phosphoglucomutase